MKSIVRPRPGKGSAKGNQDRSIIIERFRNSIAISCLLGLTWVFGFFAIDTASIIFQWLFCIFNSFQGVFIFIFSCLNQKDVKEVMFSSFRSSASKSTSSTSQTRFGTAGRGSSASPSDGTDFRSATDSEFRSTSGPAAYDNANFNNRDLEMS